ncbi:MAG: hypothetical protein LC808_03855 [Actinobacteria bacterium]|nr:hypothetical protein [Actinomycetota bacterium]
MVAAIAGNRKKGMTAAQRSYAERRRLLVLFVLGWVTFGAGALVVGAHRGGVGLVLGILALLGSVIFAEALVRAWQREAKGRSHEDRMIVSAETDG